ncbi:MAG TPA: hypothetical protein VH117_10095, partial [Edaphobacter sp.]|nr:hypothetical protein [Edaphobacter sp.]
LSSRTRTNLFTRRGFHRMTTSQIVALLLGSAAVGALVSSVITLFGQRLERKSRREELVLSEAVKLAQSNMDLTLEVAKAHTNRVTNIIPIIDMVVPHHEWLTHLLNKGKMPEGYVPAIERFRAEQEKKAKQ